MLESNLVPRRRRSDIVVENIANLPSAFYLTANIFIRYVPASTLSNAKGLYLLSSRFCRLSNWIERFGLSLRKTEHVLKHLPIAFAAVARDRVVLDVKHRVVELEPDLLERKCVAETSQALIADQRPVRDDQDHDAARLRFLEQSGCDLLDGKMIAI